MKNLGKIIILVLIVIIIQLNAAGIVFSQDFEYNKQIKFDTDSLNELYYAYINAGHSKAEAWSLTMDAQDKYRESQDKHKVKTDFANMIYISQQKEYVNSLQQNLYNEKKPEMKIRLNKMFKLAFEMTEENIKLFESDPVLYFTKNDHSILFASVNEPSGYKERFKKLNIHYDNLGIPMALRYYLTQKEMEELAKEIRYYNLLSEKERKQGYALLNGRYGNENIDHILRHLISGEYVSTSDINLIKDVQKKSVTIKKSSKRLLACFN